MAENLSEFERLKEAFKSADPNKQKIAEKLILSAAFLSEQNDILKKMIDDNGMVRVHPTNHTRQKTTEAGKQYIKNLQTYVVIIKTLNSILNGNVPDEDDEFSKFNKGEEE